MTVKPTVKPFIASNAPALVRCRAVSHPGRAIAASVALSALALGAVPLVAASTTVTVDPYGNRHPINPLIFGVNFGDPARMSVVPYTLNRWGGNSTTRYNWKVDVNNTASDWFFMNVPHWPDAGDPAPYDLNNLPNDSTADRFVLRSRAAGAQPLLTVPTIGWTPKSTGLTIVQARQKRWGASVEAYGTQEDDECTNACQFDPNCHDWCIDDAGNGCVPDGNPNQRCAAGFVANLGTSPTATSEAIGTSFVTDWMSHLIAQAGLAAAGGVRFYALDNEPGLWHYTHHDVHSGKLTYDELWTQRTVPYATAIKARDPGAKVLGPDSWGWCDYFTSAADDCNYWSGADRAAHGGTDLLQWYLERVCASPLPSGAKLVDYLDIHYYPQGSCVDGLGCDEATAEDASHSARRLRALKELYDPTWHSEDWIGVDLDAVINLVPRMKALIAGSCPGLGLAVTEYRWGPDEGESAALAQAEALAIYGREGVDLATRWVAPETGTPTEDAFRFFLDYDANPANGFQQVLGDSGRVVQTVGNPDGVGVYAVHSAGGQLFVLLFNHDTVPSTATVNFAVPVGGPATLWRFNPAAPSRITNAGSAAVAANGMSLTAPLNLPARTATLVIVSLPSGLPFRDGFETGTTAKWVH
ncbi:MAG TPA: glycoside hydrolase family 44 protein [Thermoanaerobaculia bacterium]|nr:glycoside hydrolase family 44 protein [Thermoanaerobaculia bacterium]